jgi:hypothetical protein
MIILTISILISLILIYEMFKISNEIDAKNEILDIAPKFKNLEETRKINNFYPISKENRKSFFYPGSLIKT